MSDYGVNTKHKDTFFRLVFSGERYGKTHLLELYNALNDSNYSNADDLEITTLSDVIYMKIKNDVSFLIDNRMTLFEHQSTYNPNMPLRGLIYFASLYQKFVSKYPDLNMYGSRLIKIPTPRYIVFYNGEDKRLTQERYKLRLSDAFEHENQNGDFEWTAELININYGSNKELMDKCVSLRHYSIFIHKVRKYNAETGNLTKAIDKAVDECINEGIFKDILFDLRNEVHNMLLEEFDEEKAIKSWNYTVAKLQSEIEMFKNQNEMFKNQLANMHTENDRFKLENKNNILQTVSLLREIGKDDNFIIQTLISKYNISKENVYSYL